MWGADLADPDPPPDRDAFHTHELSELWELSEELGEQILMLVLVLCFYFYERVLILVFILMLMLILMCILELSGMWEVQPLS